MDAPTRTGRDGIRQITVIGGGIAGLTAAITAAEEGVAVRLLEAHEKLGGRARSSDGPYKANLGPHVLYKDGPFCAWLRERNLMPPAARGPLSGVRVRWDGELRRTPPLGALPSALRLRGRAAPVDRSFREWVADHTDETSAQMWCRGAGVYTFHHDPGELSAAFVWARTVRTLLTPPPAARYVIGGWNRLVDLLERRARELGVAIECGHRVESVETLPAIVATELGQARELLRDETLEWRSGETVCIDLGLGSRRGDPFIVSDLDEAGWVERFTAPDPTLAPAGEELIQAQMPLRPGEPPEAAARRLERLLEASLPDLADRATWRRRQVMLGRSGALDFPGQTWRDRPRIDRGDGVFLAGDMVAQPGLLSEVAWASGRAAAKAAAELVRGVSRVRAAA